MFSNDVIAEPVLVRPAGDADSFRSGLAARWDRWWFSPESPVNLGVCRMLFFGLLFSWLMIFVRWPLAMWGTLPRSFFHPVWLFERLHLPILPQAVLVPMEWTWYAALALACVGLFTRTAAWVALVCGTYLYGLQYSYGKVDHLTAIFLFTNGILALSRCGDAVSIDAWLRRRRSLTPVALSGEYRWPVRMVWVLMCVLFFNAGMAKLILGGPAWVFSENFAILLVQRHYQTTAPPVSWGLFIAKHQLIYQAAAASAILGEAFLFLSLFNRRLRMFLPWCLLSMQIGIGLFMRVWFTPYLICYLFWVPWGRIFGHEANRKAN